MSASKSFGSKAPAVPHLTHPGGGLGGEIYDLRTDTEEAFASLENLGVVGTGPLVVAEFTNPALAVATGIEAATDVTLAARTVTAFVAGGVAALAAYPRNITFTTAGTTPADAPATATITGTDVNGAVLIEVVNVPQTATSVAGVKCFKTLTSVVYSVGQGTDATVSIGFGVVLGLPKKAATRAGGVNVLSEIAVGAVAVNGTFVTAAVCPPNGSYTPNAAPDGSNDYAVTYEKTMI